MNRMVKLRSTLLSQNQFFKQPLFKSENAENPSTSLLLRIMEDKGSHDYLPLWLIDHLLSAPHSSLILFYLSECAAVSVPMASNYHARGIFRLLTQADVTMQTFSFRENIGQNKVFKYTLVKNVDDQVVKSIRWRNFKQFFTFGHKLWHQQKQKIVFFHALVAKVNFLVAKEV